MTTIENTELTYIRSMLSNPSVLIDDRDLRYVYSGLLDTLEKLNNNIINVRHEVSRLDHKVEDICHSNQEDLRRLSVFSNACLSYLVDQHKPRHQQIPGYDDLYDAIKTNNRALFKDTLNLHKDLSNHLYCQIDIELYEDTCNQYAYNKGWQSREYGKQYAACFDQENIFEALYELIDEDNDTATYTSDDIIFYIKHLFECDARLASKLPLIDLFRIKNKDIVRDIFDYLVTCKHLFSDEDLTYLLGDMYYSELGEDRALRFEYALKLAKEPSQVLHGFYWGNEGFKYHIYSFIFDDRHIEILKESMPEISTFYESHDKKGSEGIDWKDLEDLKYWIRSYIAANNKEKSSALKY